MNEALNRNDRDMLDELLCRTLQREMPEVTYPMASARVLRKALWPEVEEYLFRLLRQLSPPERTDLEVRALMAGFTGDGWR